MQVRKLETKEREWRTFQGLTTSRLPLPLMAAPIPILDIFAGPGGLGEGFASLSGHDGHPAFRIALSIEKDAAAHQTLLLRATYRHLRDAGKTAAYYDYIRGDIDRSAFHSSPGVASASEDANQDARLAELGQTTPAVVDSWIRSAIGTAEDWVLVGGPPCQAYSLVGRARRRNDAAFEDDERHFLYREYLRIIKEHCPPYFVMENVKGILTSTHDGNPIFSRILEDLARPARDLAYDIRSLVVPDEGLGFAANDYVIQSELYGIPQRRHRVILLGVRNGRAGSVAQSLMGGAEAPTVCAVISALPRIRSRLSMGNDDLDSWRAVVGSTTRLLKGWRHEARADTIDCMECAMQARRFPRGVGARFLPRANGKSKGVSPLTAWLADASIGGVIQHEARSHIPQDIQRYFFASCFAASTGSSPRLRDFPELLLPDHRNASQANAPFRDRFRVQLRDAPATTVVSHIAKDGHYYIHFDPHQCRSLTVREAARLQTFPDNYFFEGTRTQQYTQVGNAVPPYLARSIARVVRNMIVQGDHPESG